MAALGFETSSGDFEVVDLCFAGLPDVYQPQASSSTSDKGKGRAKDEEGMTVDGKFWIVTNS
jgi:DNA polymerase delta subunit 2